MPCQSTRGQEHLCSRQNTLFLTPCVLNFCRENSLSHNVKEYPKKSRDFFYFSAKRRTFGAVKQKERKTNMARPIKETPILYGEDARRFEARMKERRRVSPEERARINAAYEAVKSVCDFI